MSLSLLNFLIIAYVMSMVACIIVLAVHSKINLRASRFAAILHALIAIVLFVQLFNAKGNTTFLVAALFATFICTGIVGFAFVIRKKFHLLIKVYFSIFVLSFPLYLYAPSKVFTIMSLGMLNADNASEIYLSNNYFLVKQQGMIKKESSATSYKVVKRMGMFNKTLARDFVFGFEPDSAIVLSFNENSEISLRGFKKNKTVNNQYKLDSADATQKTIASRDTVLKFKNK